MSQPTQSASPRPIASGFIRRLNLVTLIVAIIWWLLIGLTLSSEMDDFHYFRHGALDQVQHGDPYFSLPEWRPSAQPQVELRPDAVVAYLYPPPLAYLLQPFALLEQFPAQQLWFLINSAALAGFVWLCIRLSGSELAQRYWGLVVLGTLLAPPTRLCLQLGQLGILLALLLVGCFALAQRQVARSGLLLALAAMMKLYPALLGLYYLIRGPRKVAFWALGYAVALFGLSVQLYGITPYTNFVQKVLLSGYYPYAAEFNVSLIGYWNRLLAASLYAAPLIDAPMLARIFGLVSCLGVLATCLLTTRQTVHGLATHLQFGVWLCGMLLISPINGTYNLTLLLFPLLVVLRYLELHKDRHLRNWLILASVMVCWPPAWTDWSPMLYNSLHIGLGILFLTPAIYGLILWLWLLARLSVRANLPQTAQPAVSSSDT